MNQLKGVVNRMAAMILAAALVFSMIPFQSVNAEEMGSGAEEELIIEEGAESVPALQYVYVGAPYIVSGETEEILVSFDENQNLSYGYLVYENEGTGELLEVQAEEIQGAAVLFRMTFPDESQSGIYHLIQVRIGDGLNEYSYTFSEMGIESRFGVNQECETEPDAVVEDAEAAPEAEDAAEAEVLFLTLDENEELTEGASVEEVLEETEPLMFYSDGARAGSTGSTGSGNVIVVLDPGHGGSDGGAVANGANEKDLTLKIAKYCKEELQKYSGITVYMTRESDVYVGLTERVDYAKEKKADIFVSIHLNSTGTGSAYGAEVYYPNSNYDAALGQQGKELAQKIQNELTALGLYDRGIKIRTSDDDDTYPDGSLTDYYSVIRNSKKAGIPGIIIEHAFLDNTDDYNTYLDSDAKLKKLGQADAAGIASYFGKSTDGNTSNENQNTNQNQNQSPKADGWNLQNGKWYYYSGGTAVTGWKLVNGTWYYMNSSGVMQTGWLLLGNTWYYLRESGAMAVGWVQVNGAWYYMDGSGAMCTGWVRVNETWYYLSGSGAMCTGWLLLGNTWYYLRESGAMAVGWVQVNGVWYYMDGSGAMCTGWVRVNGTWYYLSGSGAMCTGWLLENGIWYYLKPDGAMVTGWNLINNRKYYFNNSGAMVTGYQVIDGVSYYFGDYGIDPDEGGETTKEPETEQPADGWSKQNGTWYYYSGGTKVTGWRKVGAYWYYMNSAGAMQTGWVTSSGKKYYLNPEKNADGPEGAMAVGYREIDGTWYFFNNSVSPVGALTYQGVTSIMGASALGSDKTTVVNKMVKMYNNQGKTYPAEALKSGGAANITAFCQILYEEAAAEGVKPEVVFGQAMKETGYLQFGGDVKVEQFNFCGMGATGGVEGNSFEDVRTGLRAQVQHLKAYASDEELKNPCVDPRFQYVTRNTAPYVEWLGIQENPEKRGWAASVGYGISLMNDYINPMYAL